MDAGRHGGHHGPDVLEDVSLMCLVGNYWHKKGVNKECGTHTREEKHEAFRAAYQDHIKDGKWTYEQFIDWFPRERAEMTMDEVTELADAARSR